MPLSVGSVRGHPPLGVFRAFGRGDFGNSIECYCHGFESDFGCRWFEDEDSSASCRNPSELSTCSTEKGVHLISTSPFHKDQRDGSGACYEPDESDTKNEFSDDMARTSTGPHVAPYTGLTKKKRDERSSGCSLETSGNDKLGGTNQEWDPRRKGGVPDNWRYQDPGRRGTASRHDCDHFPGRVFERDQNVKDQNLGNNHNEAEERELTPQNIIMKPPTPADFIADRSNGKPCSDNENNVKAEGERNLSLECNATDRKTDRCHGIEYFQKAKDQLPPDCVGNSTANSQFAGRNGDLPDRYASTKDTAPYKPQGDGENISRNLGRNCTQDPSAEPPEENDEAIIEDTKERINPRESIVRRGRSGSSDGEKAETKSSACHEPSSGELKAVSAQEFAKGKTFAHRHDVTETQTSPLQKNPQAISSIVSEIVAQMDFSRTEWKVDSKTPADHCSQRDPALSMKCGRQSHFGTLDRMAESPPEGSDLNAVPSVSSAQISFNRYDTEGHTTTSREHCIKGIGNGRLGALVYDEKLSPTQESMPIAFGEQPLKGICNSILNSTVKIYVTHCSPNYSIPWQMHRQMQSTCSGFIISGRQIITNAHALRNNTMVRVKKHNGEQMHTAHVLAVGNECDLALLTIVEDDFWHGTIPMHFGQLPKVHASVFVVGYPTNSEKVSATAAVVLRVGIQDYAHGASQLIGIQIDSPIAPGHAGAPVLNSLNEVVGVAFQSPRTCNSGEVGCLVPEKVVVHFLRDYQTNGTYTGLCHCGFQWQKMENRSLRKSMKMADGDSGILIRRVHRSSPAFQVLQEGDVVKAIDGIPISNAGTIPYCSGEQISFHHIVNEKFIGATIRLEILRAGRNTEITCKLGGTSDNFLVSASKHRDKLEYFIVAGFVFIALSEPYLIAEYGEEWDLRAPVRLLERLMYGLKEREDEHIVILSQVLRAEINVGYEGVRNTQVHRFNDKPIRNLGHLAQLVEGCVADYFRFDLGDEIVVISREESAKASVAILNTYCIPKAHNIESLVLESRRNLQSPRRA